MAKIGIIVNKGGGSAREEAVEAIKKTLSQHGTGFDLRVVEGKDIKKNARELVESGCNPVAGGGGDGTINCVSGVVKDSPVALGVLPLGTLNHFAKDLKVPLDPAQAAANLIFGSIRMVDYASVNGEVFLNN